uniref:Zinc finger protein RFP n=1 Tax=Chelonoidis abingdonii TaxID=106734 RepID=A0A8C0GWE4_CHEAB
SAIGPQPSPGGQDPMESLQEEATCPVCLEYFTELVTLECGHNFCRACISQCWEGSDTAASCPQCRETVQQRNLRPNKQLANILELVKQLSLQAVKGAGGDGVCGEHQEALKLFCEEDQTPICVVCDRSRAHRAHRVVPIEEAAQEYKKFSLLHTQLSMKGPRAPSMSLTSPCPIFLQKQIQSERQKIVSEFQQLQQFLEEQERLLLAQLEKLDEEIVRIQNENVSKLSEQISHLSELISELEGKLLQGSQLPCSVPHAGSPANQLLPLFPAAISCSTVYTEQDLPNNPERFDSWGCVLGCEGFTSGRHCWEVEVGDGGFWAVGVARESVGRKGEISRSPEGGIWAVVCLGVYFQALTSPATPLPLSRAPSRIRVCLDCDRGQVTFIDAGDEAPIFTFPPGSVPGGRIRPRFWAGLGSQLSLCP